MLSSFLDTKVFKIRRAECNKKPVQNLEVGNAVTEIKFMNIFVEMKFIQDVTLSYVVSCYYSEGDDTFVSRSCSIGDLSGDPP